MSTRNWQEQSTPRKPHESRYESLTIQHPLKQVRGDFLMSSWVVTSPHLRVGPEQKYGEFFCESQRKVQQWPNKNNYTRVFIHESSAYLNIVWYLYPYPLLSLSLSIIIIFLSLYLSVISAYATRACSHERQRGLRWNASPMNSSESPRKLVGDITMSTLALEQIFQKIAELLDEEGAKRSSCHSYCPC